MCARLTHGLSFVVVLLLLLITLDLQFYHGELPCPLCSLQRVTFVGLAIWFLLGFFIPQRFFRLFIAAISTITALLGLLLAGRQVWLQHFPPPDSNECGVSLQYMLHMLPVNQVLQRVFAGTAECTQSGLTFLSLNMAEWSAVWFVVFIAVSVYLLRAAVRRQ